MDNDLEYTGGDLDYSSRRNKKLTQTKHDVLYGVFVSDDTDSDDYSSKNKKRKFYADLTRPVSFVIR